MYSTPEVFGGCQSLSGINTTYLFLACQCLASLSITHGLSVILLTVPWISASSTLFHTTPSSSHVLDPLNPFRMRELKMTDVRLVDKNKGEYRPKIGEERPKRGSLFDVHV